MKNRFHNLPHIPCLCPAAKPCFYVHRGRIPVTACGDLIQAQIKGYDYLNDELGNDEIAHNDKITGQRLRVFCVYRHSHSIEVECPKSAGTNKLDLKCLSAGARRRS